MGELIGPEGDGSDASVILGPNVSIIEGDPVDIEDSPDHRRARSSEDLFGDEADDEYWISAANGEKGYFGHNPADTTFVWHEAISSSDHCLADGHGALIGPKLNPITPDPILLARRVSLQKIDWVGIPARITPLKSKDRRLVAKSLVASTIRGLIRGLYLNPRNHERIS